MGRIFVLLCQWRLLTSRYVIMSPRFIACNYETEKHVPLFSKESEILFASGDACGMLYDIQCIWYPVSSYFSIEFFATMF